MYPFGYSAPSTSSGSNNNTAASFQAFFEGWLVRQEHYLDELLSSQQNCHESREDDLRELISRVLSHYNQYYEEKSRIAHHDVFLVLSPVWFTHLERAFFWIAGFKPDLVFHLVSSSVDDLTPDQNARMQRLRAETRAFHKELENNLATVQESIATLPAVEAAKRSVQVRDGEIFHGADEFVASLKGELESVVANADGLRIRTAINVMEALNPVQNLKLLTAATQLQLRIRSSGLQREQSS